MSAPSNNPNNHNNNSDNNNSQGTRKKGNPRPRSNTPTKDKQASAGDAGQVRPPNSAAASAHQMQQHQQQQRQDMLLDTDEDVLLGFTAGSQQQQPVQGKPPLAPLQQPQAQTRAAAAAAVAIAVASPPRPLTSPSPAGQHQQQHSPMPQHVLAAAASQDASPRAPTPQERPTSPAAPATCGGTASGPRRPALPTPSVKAAPAHLAASAAQAFAAALAQAQHNKAQQQQQHQGGTAIPEFATAPHDKATMTHELPHASVIATFDFEGQSFVGVLGVTWAQAPAHKGKNTLTPRFVRVLVDASHPLPRVGYMIRGTTTSPDAKMHANFKLAWATVNETRYRPTAACGNLASATAYFKDLAAADIADADSELLLAGFAQHEPLKILRLEKKTQDYLVTLESDEVSLPLKLWSKTELEVGATHVFTGAWAVTLFDGALSITLNTCWPFTSAAG